MLDNEEQAMSPLPQQPKVVHTYTFWDALKEVFNGKRIMKQEWGNTEFYGVVQDGVLMIHKDDNKLHQWILTESDTVGDDWILLPEGN